jgi:hypothetical protein
MFPLNAPHSRAGFKARHPSSIDVVIVAISNNLIKLCHNPKIKLTHILKEYLQKKTRYDLKFDA